MEHSVPELLFQTSLIASFVAGMVALFAPCCITFLLPAYLASVFKEKEKVLLMTFVFGLGIFIVLLPAVLGVAFISQFLFRYHNTIYIFGGVVMLGVALTTLLGVKMPMPRLPGAQVTGKTDMLSIFTLGIFSGITSACCAPVLIGILTLTFLSPNFFGALLIGGVYVLGMVTPLLLMSVFLNGQMPKVQALRRPMAALKIFSKEYPIILSNVVAAAIFFITGGLILILASTDRLSMQGASAMTQTVQNIGGAVNSLVGGNMVVNLIFFAGIIYFLYRISKKI